MSTADLQRLEQLLHRAPHGRDPDAGPLLQRISKDLAERRTHNSADSADVFRTASALLNRFSGTVHGQARIAGLLDCFRYLYQAGDFHRALGAACAVEAVAARMENTDQVSLAKNLQGVALTELGDVGKALLC